MHKIEKIIIAILVLVIIAHLFKHTLGGVLSVVFGLLFLIPNLIYLCITGLVIIGIYRLYKIFGGRIT